MDQRVVEIERLLDAVIADTDVECVSAHSLRALALAFDRITRKAGGFGTVLVGEVARKGAWNDGRARNAEDWVARTTGTGWGDAKATVELGQRLRSLPGTKDALLEGRISTTQAGIVARGASADPASEVRLLDLAGHGSVKELSDASNRVVAAATGQVADEQAAVHRTRFLRTWVDGQGGFNIQGRLTKAAGAKVLAVLEPLMETEFADARRQGRRESPDAYRADALVTMAERAMRGHRGSRPVGGRGDAAVPACDVGSDDGGAGAVLVEAACDCDVPASAHVIVRVDHAALLRARVEPGEICEIDGIGPIPVSDAFGFMSDPFVTALLVDGADVLAASTTTRTIRKPLRLALEARDRVCVVPGCGIANGLEFDHLVPYAQGGPTSIDNVQRLCKHHHRLKTSGAATLTRRETPDGPVFGWSPRTSEAEDPPPVGAIVAGAAGRSPARASGGSPGGSAGGEPERTLWTA